MILVGVFDSARQMDLCTIFKIHGEHINRFLILEIFVSNLIFKPLALN